MPYRFWFAFSYFRPALARIPGWVVRSRELSNFTYDLTDLSREYLAGVVSWISGMSWEAACGFIAEFYRDAEPLRAHVARCTAQTPDRFVSDTSAKPGRRLLYYALARTLKPRTILEAGVHRGFGTVILDAALEKNREEGCPGRVIGVDLNPDAGYLVQKPYDQHAQVIAGDVLSFLEHGLDRMVDLYIHDTANDAGLESREYELVEKRLAPRAVILSVWHTGVLMKFARRTGRKYLMFKEETRESWFPGSTMGIAFKPLQEGA